MGLNAIPLELDAQMFLRLLVAVVLGALVGYERERAGKPAGVRTHGMVSLGAALFAVVSPGPRGRPNRDWHRVPGRWRDPAPARQRPWIDDRRQFRGDSGHRPGRRRGDGIHVGGDSSISLFAAALRPPPGTQIRPLRSGIAPPHLPLIGFTR